MSVCTARSLAVARTKMACIIGPENLIAKVFLDVFSRSCSNIRDEEQLRIGLNKLAKYTYQLYELKLDATKELSKADSKDDT